MHLSIYLSIYLSIWCVHRSLYGLRWVFEVFISSGFQEFVGPDVGGSGSFRGAAEGSVKGCIRLYGKMGGSLPWSRTYMFKVSGLF